MWAVWCDGRIILLAISSYQPVRAGLDLYGLLLASSLPAVFSVGIPVAATDGHVLDQIWAFVVETVISTSTTFLLTDLTALALLKLGEKIRLIDSEPENEVRERRAVVRARALVAVERNISGDNQLLAAFPPPSSTSLVPKKGAASTFVALPAECNMRQRQISTTGSREEGAPGKPLEKKPFKINLNFSPHRDE